jgi:hypothetical protein
MSVRSSRLSLMKQHLKMCTYEAQKMAGTCTTQKKTAVLTGDRYLASQVTMSALQILTDWQRRPFSCLRRCQLCQQNRFVS